MAAFVKTIEHVEVLMSDALGLEGVTVDLGRSQDWTQCVPFHTMRADSYGTDNLTNRAVSIEMHDNAGKAALTVRRATVNTPGRLLVRITVVEFGPTVTVQQGPAALIGLSVSSPVNAVVPGNAFVVFNQHGNPATLEDDFDAGCIRAQIDSPTAVSFHREDVGDVAADWTIRWYLIESDGVDFQTEYLQWRSAAADVQADLSLLTSVDPATTFLVCSYQTSESRDDMRDAVAQLAILDANTVRWYRDHGGIPDAEIEVGVWVVRTTGATVQRFATDVEGAIVIDQPIGQSPPNQTLALPSLNVGLGSYPVTDQTSGNVIEKLMHTVQLIDAETVRLERRQDTAIAGLNSLIRFEVITFAGILGPAIFQYLSPRKVTGEIAKPVRNGYFLYTAARSTEMTVYNASILDEQGNIPAHGDALDIRFPVSKPGTQPIVLAWLTFKADEADTDENAILQKVITTADDPAQGWIEEDGDGTTSGSILFRILSPPATDYDALKGNVGYVYDVQIKLGDGKLSTLEKGTALWATDVTKSHS